MTIDVWYAILRSPHRHVIASAGLEAADMFAASYPCDRAAQWWMWRNP